MKIGIVVGRFQVPDMHDAHKAVLDKAVAECDKVYVVLGCSEVKLSTHNPLDFWSRGDMIRTAYEGKVKTVSLNDHPSDEYWCQTLDEIIDQINAFEFDENDFILYGGRDSYLPRYTGKYKDHCIVQEVMEVSGTKIREWTSHPDAIINSVEWRQGVIWGRTNQYPTCFTTVDVAIFNERYDKILLGKKRGMDLWQLIGGFSDPESFRFEDDAYREAREEASVRIDLTTYLASAKTDDWRYRNEPHCIKSLLFAARTLDTGVANDDIEEVRWFDNYTLLKDLSIVADCHKDFVELALQYAYPMSIDPPHTFIGKGTKEYADFIQPT